MALGFLTRVIMNARTKKISSVQYTLIKDRNFGYLFDLAGPGWQRFVRDEKTLKFTYIPVDKEEVVTVMRATQDAIVLGGDVLGLVSQVRKRK